MLIRNKTLHLSPLSNNHNLAMGLHFPLRRLNTWFIFYWEHYSKSSMEWVPAKSVKVLIICWDFCLPAHSVLIAAALTNSTAAQKWEENGEQQDLSTYLCCQFLLHFTEIHAGTLYDTIWVIDFYLFKYLCCASVVFLCTVNEVQALVCHLCQFAL